MQTQKLLERIKETAYLTGNFTTRAGKKTHYYIDKYRFETQPDILKGLVQALLPLFPAPNTFQRLVCPALGAVPLGSACAVALNKPLLIIQKEMSDQCHWQQRLIGNYVPGEHVVLLGEHFLFGEHFFYWMNIFFIERRFFLLGEHFYWVNIFVVG